MTQLSLFQDAVPEIHKPTLEKLKQLAKSSIIGFDIETSNDLLLIKDPLVREFYKKGALGLSFVSEMIYLSLWSKDYPQGLAFEKEDLENEVLMNALRKLFTKDGTIFVGHYAVIDLRMMCGKYNIPVPKKLWDTYTNEMLRGDADPSKSYLEGARSFSLKALVDFYQIKESNEILPVLEALAEDTGQTVDAAYAAMKKNRALLEGLTKATASRYAVLDTYYTVQVMLAQMKFFKDKKDEYPNIMDILSFEGRFNRACAAMCAEGVPVNKRYLREKMAIWDKEMHDAVQRMHQQCVEVLQEKKLRLEAEEATPENFDAIQEVQSDLEYLGVKTKLSDKGTVQGFNPNRARDRQIYFQKVLDIHPPAKSAPTQYLYTDTGAYSYGKAAMEWYYDRYGSLLEDYLLFKKNEKKMQKADELLMHAYSDNKVHSLITSSAVTGRTASSQPNMQNLKMSNDRDRKKSSNFQGTLCSLPGYGLFGVDISNAETYMGAIIAHDNLMMEALYDSDFHSQMAARYFPILWQQALEAERNGDGGELKKAIRKASKAITFGTAYGMGAVKLARHADMQVAIMPKEELLDFLRQDKNAHNWLINHHVLPHTIFQEAEEHFALYGEEPPGYLWEAAIDEGYDLVWYLRDNDGSFLGRLPCKVSANISEEEWIFAGKCWNAKAILEDKERAFPATAYAKEQAERFANQNGYVQAWTGRRLFIREARKAWNAICQGGVGELAKRWVVLVHEEFEKHRELLDARLVNFVHDEIVIMCPLESAEIAVKIALNCLTKVIETQPLDNSGRHWFDRTVPKGRFLAGFEHEDNSDKWGKVVYYEYPFDKGLNWEEDYSDEHIRNLLQEFAKPERQYQIFANRRFYLPEIPEGDIGNAGLTLKEYIKTLQYAATRTQDNAKQTILDNLEQIARSFQTALKLPVVGLKSLLQGETL